MLGLGRTDTSCYRKMVLLTLSSLERFWYYGLVQIRSTFLVDAIYSSLGVRIETSNIYTQTECPIKLLLTYC